ncbi:MAG: hypothetical protein H0W76_04570 [Pyrinomonadaceae bacterium]|nr:hypothetical protein [Pyrinomonadaceae bacterium]
MNIIENLEKVHVAVVRDKVVPNEAGQKGELGKAIGKLAVKAIMGGLKSDDWKTYMSLFADNAEQLKLLTEETQGEDSYLPEARAYIVSNAVCAAGTNTFTAARVDTQLINIVNNNPDNPPLAKPLIIPPL